MRRLKYYETESVQVFRATKKEDANRIAIHLLYPTRDEIARAVEDAEAKLFEQVILHSKATWPYKNRAS